MSVQSCYWDRTTILINYKPGHTNETTNKEMGLEGTNRRPKMGPQKTNAIRLKEGRPTTSANKYQETETRTTGTTGGGKKQKGNRKMKEKSGSSGVIKTEGQSRRYGEV